MEPERVWGEDRETSSFSFLFFEEIPWLAGFPIRIFKSSFSFRFIFPFSLLLPLNFGDAFFGVLLVRRHAGLSFLLFFFCSISRPRRTNSLSLLLPRVLPFALDPFFFFPFFSFFLWVGPTGSSVWFDSGKCETGPSPLFFFFFGSRPRATMDRFFFSFFFSLLFRPVYSSHLSFLVLGEARSALLFFFFFPWSFLNLWPCEPPG